MQTDGWRPYAVGAGIGAVDLVAMATAGRPIGVTTAFEKAAAALIEGAGGRKLIEKYKEARGEEPGVDWESALVAGIGIGSVLASLVGPRKAVKRKSRLRARDVLTAFGGGALVMFGARAAGGCTSGHGISGTMQFAASSWLFTALIFGTGALISNARKGS